MTAKLGSLCRFINGGTPSKDVDAYFRGNIPWITSADITGPIAETARSFITPEAVQNSATNQVKKGAVLLVTRTGVGKVAIAGCDLCFSQDITAILPDVQRLDAGYLVHFLRTQQSYFDRYARGATIKGVTRDVVSNLDIPLPSLREQRRIAAILDQADALRTKRREALAQINYLAQSIFVEMFGDPVTNSKGWPTVRLEDVSTKITDGEHLTPIRQESGIKLLSARNVRDGFLDFENVDYVGEEEYARISKRCNPEYGDILISCSGSIGRVAPVETTEPLSMVRSAALVKPDTSKVTNKFIEHWLRTPYLQQLMVKSAHSSSQANLFQGPIRALPVLVPPLKEQRQFDARLGRLAGITRAHRAASTELGTLFASLQHRAFRGEL